MNEHNQKHLTLSNRTYIEQELLQKSTFSSIGKNLHKDPSTISKEVKRYSKTVPAKYSYKCNRFRKILPIFIGVTRFPHKKYPETIFSGYFLFCGKLCDYIVFHSYISWIFFFLLTYVCSCNSDISWKKRFPSVDVMGRYPTSSTTNRFDFCIRFILALLRRSISCVRSVCINDCMVV